MLSRSRETYPETSRSVWQLQERNYYMKYSYPYLEMDTQSPFKDRDSYRVGSDSEAMSQPTNSSRKHFSDWERSVPKELSTV